MEAIELFERRWAALREGREPPPLMLVVDASPIRGRAVAMCTITFVAAVMLVVIALGVLFAGMM